MSASMELHVALSRRLDATEAYRLANAYRAEVLNREADDLVAACPEHSKDADEVWMDCPCEYADELRRKAALASPPAAPADVVVYRAEYGSETDGARLYATQEAARAYCEALAAADGMTGIVSWVPEDGSPEAAEELTFFDLVHRDGDDMPTQSCSGYYVTPVTAPATYEPEATS